ncbi:hypothetical protein [Nocardioides yefusunii]|uniref:Secreted protein n=1 Tax=Nocardioides yefusunii TaxID=2500546 RepID=A0ABW1QT86_9ACTN|nr:hypothetical protein [Nocardioides yefusunii]
MDIDEQETCAAPDPLAVWGRVLRRVRAVTTALVVGGVVAAALYVWWTWEFDGPGSMAAESAATAPTGSPAPDPREPVAGADSPVEVLKAWDLARQDAWEAGDEAALLRLYADEAEAGAADAAALRRWIDAGWRVHGVAPRVVAVREVERTERRWVLDVTDQFEGAVARSTDGDEERALPRGAVRERRLVLVPGGADAPGEAWAVLEVNEPDVVPKRRSR